MAVMLYEEEKLKVMLPVEELDPILKAEVLEEEAP